MCFYERHEIVLSAPLPLDATNVRENGDEHKEKQKSSITKKILELVKNVMPGSDITRLQVPVQFNIPKSHLQCYGESIYSYGETDLLHACTLAPTPLHRFLKVVAWSLSTFRLYPFGVAPLNPILGETHHVSVGDFNVLLEQVSHHPPISALYATNETNKIRLQWTCRIQPHFYGSTMEAEVRGPTTLWLDMHNEVYTCTHPNVLVRFLPVPGNELAGSSTIKCVSSGLEATVTFVRRTCFGMKGTIGQVRGQVWDTHSKASLYEIEGAWNKRVMLKHTKTGEMSVLFDGANALKNMKAPVFRNEQDELEPTESVVVWRAAMAGIARKDWQMARKGKHEVEEKQRAIAKQRKKDGVVWIPKHFIEVEEEHWRWHHDGKPVPPAPLVVPS